MINMDNFTNFNWCKYYFLFNTFLKLKKGVANMDLNAWERNDNEGVWGSLLSYSNVLICYLAFELPNF